MANTDYGANTSNLKHNGNFINSVSEIQSSDFFGDDLCNISFYEDKSFNNKDIEVGTVLVWKGPGISKDGKGWIGHVATIVDVQRDKNGNVTNIKIIQGHISGGKTEITDIPNQADLNSYRGEFLGFGEIGKDSLKSVL